MLVLVARQFLWYSQSRISVFRSGWWGSPMALVFCDSHWYCFWCFDSWLAWVVSLWLLWARSGFRWKISGKFLKKMWFSMAFVVFTGDFFSPPVTSIVVGWLLLVVLIINQTLLLVVLIINRDRRWLLMVLITRIMIFVVGCRNPTSLGAFRWVSTSSWYFLVRSNRPWSFAVRSNWLLVFCGKIRSALVFCGGFRSLIGVSSEIQPALAF